MTKSANKSTQEATHGIVGTAVALATACGVSTRTIATWKTLAGFPVRDDGRFSIWQIAAWYWQSGPGATKQALALDAELAGDGEESPGLERFRLARAGQEEIKLAQLRSQVMDRGWMHSRLVEIASLIRGCGEQLQREFGDDAVAVLNECLDDIDRRIGDMVPHDAVGGFHG